MVRCVPSISVRANGSWTARSRRPTGVLALQARTVSRPFACRDTRGYVPRSLGDAAEAATR
jgi:hypothetical protein